MRVLQLMSSLSAGGIESLVMDAYESIDSKKYTFDFAIVNPHDQIHEWRINKAFSNVIVLADAIGKRGYFHKIMWRLTAIYNYYLLLKRETYHVVHCHMYEFPLPYILLAKIRGIPVRIIHCHSSGTDTLFFTCNAAKLFRNISFKLATSLIACSDVAAKWFYGCAPCDIIHNGIHLKDIIESKERKKRILHVGRYCTAKNHKFLLEVFSEIYNMDQEYELVLVGFGSMETYLKKMTDSMGLSMCVHFCDTNADVYTLMRTSACFVLPSIYEGFGIVLLEAQASNLKCVVSTAVTKDVNCGLCTYVSLAETANSWAKEVLSVINDKSMVLDAYKLKSFNIDVIVKKWEHIYDSTYNKLSC
ncbi:glycosyl transferase family 1 [Clostridia bacterium]|nr:glycosyl transferase family 1 [Clostridia bacterium]